MLILAALRAGGRAQGQKMTGRGEGQGALGARPLPLHSGGRKGFRPLGEPTETYFTPLPSPPCFRGCCWPWTQTCVFTSRRPKGGRKTTPRSWFGAALNEFSACAPSPDADSFWGLDWRLTGPAPRPAWPLRLCRRVREIESRMAGSGCFHLGHLFQNAPVWVLCPPRCRELSYGRNEEELEGQDSINPLVPHSPSASPGTPRRAEAQYLLKRPFSLAAL